jgi:4-carboxymuconolactone decarboxylase
MTAPAITIRPDRRARVTAVHRTVDVPDARPTDDTVQDVAPDLGRYILQAAFGDETDRPGLDPRSRELVTIAALATVGAAASDLKRHIVAGLDAALTREEIVEAITQVGVPHAGFASALTSIGIAHEVFAELDAAPSAP